MQRPTLIRTTSGLDLPARGRFWADPGTGRVLMSELITEDPMVRATIDVGYQLDPAVGLMGPAEMRERYEGRRDGVVIEGTASYGRIRQFQVLANERMGRLEQSPPDVTGVGRSSAPVDPGVSAFNLIEAATVMEVGTNGQSAVPIVPPAGPDLGKPQSFRAGTELALVDFVVSDRADRPRARSVGQGLRGQGRR